MYTYFVSDGILVDYIVVEGQSYSLETVEIVDQSLHGKSVEYKWLADLTDGQIAVELATFTICYENEVHSYFNPPLTSIIQIYKE